MAQLDRRGFMMLAAAGSLALPSLAHAFPSRAKRTRDTILEWTLLREGLWVSAGHIPGGNVVIAKGSGLRGRGEGVVIDSKFASVSGAILSDAQRLADAPPERLALVNTHHHADHTSGNATFTLGGARIIAHANAVPRIVGQIDRYRQGASNAVNDARAIDANNAALIRAAEGESLMAGVLTPGHVIPLVGVGDRGHLSIGMDRSAELHHFGIGHTDNDLVIRFTDANVVHAGDLVFNAMHPFFDTAGGGTARGWIECVDRLEKLCDNDTIVVPGHGPVGDVEAVRAQKRYIEQLIEAVQESQDAGKTKEETVAQTFPFMEGLAGDQIRPRAISAVWDELEHEKR